MVDAAINIAAEQVIEYSAYGALLAACGQPRTHGGTAEPVPHQRDRRVRPPRLLGRSRRGDRRTVGWPYARRIGRPDWATDPSLSTAAGRRSEQHDLIDEHLADWCAQRTGDEIVERLWDAGVPVGKVMQPHRQTELPQLAFRGFFEDVGHPVNAPTKHSTLPFRLSRGPDRVHARARAAARASTTASCCPSSGSTDDEIAELEADGVIGRRARDARQQGKDVGRARVER